MKDGADSQQLDLKWENLCQMGTVFDSKVDWKARLLSTKTK